MPSARVEQTLERFSEDESLTGELTDPTATALLQWIEQQVQLADALPDDQAFQQQVLKIRAAARTAAQAVAEDAKAGTAVDVVARAQAALQAAPATSAAPTAQDSAVDDPQPATATPPAASAAEVEPIHAPRSKRRAIWNSVRRRIGRWMQRKGE